MVSSSPSIFKSFLHRQPIHSQPPSPSTLHAATDSMAGIVSLSAADADDSAKAAEANQFRFVTGNYRPEDRSHVMRESWRQRKCQASSKAHLGGRKHKLAPAKKASSRSQTGHGPHPADDGVRKASRERNAEVNDSYGHLQPYANNALLDPVALQAQLLAARDWDEYDVSKQESIADWSRLEMMESISAQAMTVTLGHPLSAAKTDPFDTFPVLMSAEDQGLLHHWLSTYATMMFDNATELTFNPMRDVWIPMDFSNSASFHGMLAHSAAHLAYLRGEKFSIEAIQHKLEATRQVNQWLSDPNKATSDDVMSASLRLLTFERYWGAEDVWRIHRNGLDQLLQARGGFESFGDNWRLELVVKLVSLMSKPSWFYAANRVSAISHEPSLSNPFLTTTVNFDHQKLQGLWFLSFVEDIRSLTIAITGDSTKDDTSYPAISQATRLLHSLWSAKANSSMSLRPDLGETSRLTCLLYLVNTFKESKSLSSMDAKRELKELDRTLQDSESFWSSSAENLQHILLQATDQGLVSSEKLNYITSLIEAIRLLSPMTRRRVEQCLLQILGRDMNEHDQATMWTVDSLLKEIRGQIWGNWS